MFLFIYLFLFIFYTWFGDVITSFFNLFHPLRGIKSSFALYVLLLLSSYITISRNILFESVFYMIRNLFITCIFVLNLFLFIFFTCFGEYDDIIFYFFESIARYKVHIYSSLFFFNYFITLLFKGIFYLKVYTFS